MKTYKISSKPLHCFVEVKVLNGTDQKKLLLELAEVVKTFPPGSSLLEYYKYLVNAMILNSNVIISNYVKNVEEEDDISKDTEQSVYTYLYKCVIHLYKFYSIEAICNFSNNNTFLELNKEDIAIIDGVGPVLKSANPELFDINENVSVIPSRTLTEIELLNKCLKANIIGQDETIDTIIKHVKLKEAGLASFFTLFLIGKSGVGKTLTPEVLAEFYTGNRIIRIDCAAMTNGNEKATLFGAPPGYIGNKPKSLLAEKADQSNNWVFLFDEIEKADAALLDNLLGLLDKGVVRDSNGEELDFTHSIFIFTSNYGIEYERESSKIGWNKSNCLRVQTKEEIMDKVKSKFRMELLNRIDEIIVMNNLSKSNCLKIVALELGGYPVVGNKTVLNYIVDNAFSEEFGARNLKRFIKINIGVPLADFLLSNNITDAERPLVIIRNNKIKIKRQSGPGLQSPYTGLTLG